MNTGQNALGPSGYGRIRESLHPGSVPLSCAGDSSMAEDVTVDADGNVYGADFLMNVRKFVKK